MELMNGQMDLSILDIGEMISLMDMVKNYMQMETFTKEIGRMDWQMDQASIKKPTVPIIQANGRIIYHMVRVRKLQGMRILFLKEYFTKEKSKVLELIDFQMVVYIQVSLIIISSMEQGHLNGLMVKFTKEVGFKIKCQDWAK